MPLSTDTMRVDKISIHFEVGSCLLYDLPIQDIVVEIGYTNIDVLLRKSRGASMRRVFNEKLSEDTIEDAIDFVKRNLQGTILGVIVEANFVKPMIGTDDDDDRLVGIHRFRYDSTSEIVTALITKSAKGIASGSNTDWKSIKGSPFTSDEFWELPFLSAVARDVDEITAGVGYPTDITEQAIKFRVMQNL